MTGLAQAAALLAIFGAEVERAGVEDWAPRLHAQIAQESSWRPDVCSPFACGLAQFTDPTWEDIAPYTDPSCEGVAVTDPACSVRAQIVYMSRLLRRFRDAADRTNEWRFAWMGYNAGPGWVKKERRRCAQRVGCDPDVWEDVQTACMRAAHNCDESRNYIRRIEARL